MVLQTKNGSETPQVFLNHKFKSKIPLHIRKRGKPRRLSLVKNSYFTSRMRGANKLHILPHQYQSWETSPPQISRCAGIP